MVVLYFTAIQGDRQSEHIGEWNVTFRRLYDIYVLAVAARICKWFLFDLVKHMYLPGQQMLLKIDRHDIIYA